MPAQERQVWSVSEVNGALREIIEGSLLPVWVAGEIGNLTIHRSGHVYMTMKDSASQLRSVFFNGAASCRALGLKEGDQVEAHGKLSVYMARGEYQLSIKSLRPLGLGALQRKFEELKAKLAKEGLFDESRKRPLPFLPRRIGVVTSPDGAALHDFLKIAFDRNPSLQIRVCPAAVQGSGAAKELAGGVDFLSRKGDVDVIVVTRGGGSLEDLWPFNEEVLARAIAASRVPVVSAVGHEIDFTIADFVADFRAPTPSGAAEAIVPELDSLLSSIATLRKRMVSQTSLAFERERGRLHRIVSSPSLHQPSFMVMERRQGIDELMKRLEQSILSSMERQRGRLEAQCASLKALSPFNVLKRGYSLLLDESGSRIVSDPETPAGIPLLAVLSEGVLKVRSEGGEKRLFDSSSIALNLQK